MSCKSFTVVLFMHVPPSSCFHPSLKILCIAVLLLILARVRHVRCCSRRRKPILRVRRVWGFRFCLAVVSVDGITWCLPMCVCGCVGKENSLTPFHQTPSPLAGVILNLNHVAIMHETGGVTSKVLA
jgi:hypothetical protein